MGLRNRVLARARCTDLDSAPRLRVRLRVAIAEDFQSGRVQQVDGWLLSRTQLDLYRLAAALT